MKQLFTFFLFCFVALQLGATDAPVGYKFTAQKKQDLLSTTFELDSDQGYVGTIVKSRFPFRFRTNFDLYDSYGKWEATGVCRILCLGLVKVWGTKIDVYDNSGGHIENGTPIGFIDGQVVTSEPAKFSIYDADSQRVGIAYLDDTKSGFTIVHPDNNKHVLARLIRNFVQDTIDPWKIHVYDPNTIDPRIIKIFAAFAVDSQEYFKVDN